LFKKGPDASVNGLLTDNTGLLFDIKRFHLETREVEDYGFAYQSLTHKMSKRLFLLGGQYQVPVFKGPVPDVLLRAAN
jgi:hypothetical protein